MKTIRRIFKELILMRRMLYNRMYLSKASQRDTITDFHRLYYDSGEFDKTWWATFWMGYKTWKCPLDLWLYQELLFRLRPDFIIETGTAFGGSALYLASICELIGTGHVVTIDVDLHPDRPSHPRITYLQGSSVAPEIIAEVTKIISKTSILVILDSDHRKDHVLRELELYSPLVGIGGYMIVEDTNMNGHPVDKDFGPCSYEAVEEFLSKRNDFIHDTSMDKFLLTFNPGGYLKRIA